MAKAALENAVWDLDAQQQGISLAKLLGGTRETIPCGVSIGIQATPEKLMETIAKELAAGYQRIKLKCKPGWDSAIFAMVRERWPDILLSCDANSAYRLDAADHIAAWDQFNLTTSTSTPSCSAASAQRSVSTSASATVATLAQPSNLAAARSST